MDTIANEQEVSVESPAVKFDFTKLDDVKRFKQTLPNAVVEPGASTEAFKTVFEKYWEVKKAKLVEQNKPIPKFVYGTAQILIIARCLSVDCPRTIIEYQLNKYTYNNNLCLPPVSDSTLGQYIPDVKNWAVNIWKARLGYLQAGGTTCTERQGPINQAQQKKLLDVEAAIREKFKRCGFDKSSVLQQEIFDIGNILYSRERQSKQERRAEKENKKKSQQVRRRQDKELFGRALMNIAEGTATISSLQAAMTSPEEVKPTTTDESEQDVEIIADSGADGQAKVEFAPTSPVPFTLSEISAASSSNERHRIADDISLPPSSSKKKRRDIIPIDTISGKKTSDDIISRNWQARSSGFEDIMKSIVQQTSSTQNLITAMSMQNERIMETNAQTAQLFAQSITLMMQMIQSNNSKKD